MCRLLNQYSTIRNELVINYLIMRKALGILGITFPLVLIIGNLILADSQVIMDSVSEYYYTGMRNVFVGFLCCIALFLFSYKGYAYIDDLLGNIGCIASLIVAFTPCGPDSVWREFHPISTWVHNISAICLFIVLILFTFLFTRSNILSLWDNRRYHTHKIWRNVIYIVCGTLMSISLLALIIMVWCEVRLSFKYEFWLESIILFLFGISWLVKGGAILRDQ